MAFKLKDYKNILHSLKALNDQKWLTITQAKKLIDTNPSSLYSSLIMRHDVDRSPENSLRIAQLEASINVKATYYFRCDAKGRFPANYIKAIANLKHEVGYHYECLSRCNGVLPKALAQFKSNLKTFREIAPCTSVSMHGAPLSRHNNKDLLVGQKLSTYNLICDAVLDFAHIPLIYLTDTGGRWNISTDYNLRDYVGISTLSPHLPDAPGFANWVAQTPRPLILSTHPERWGYNLPNYAIAHVRDIFSNRAKNVIRLFRKERFK